jgi:hypothetical protein
LRYLSNGALGVISGNSSRSLMGMPSEDG